MYSIGLVTEKTSKSAAQQMLKTLVCNATSAIAEVAKLALLIALCPTWKLQTFMPFTFKLTVHCIQNLSNCFEIKSFVPRIVECNKLFFV